MTEQQVIDNIQEIRAFAGDRSVMRALHFFEENKRVEAEVAAFKEGRFADFLANITASGNSSWKWLQNCYTTASVQEQGISIALALTGAVYCREAARRMPHPRRRLRRRHHGYAAKMIS